MDGKPRQVRFAWVIVTRLPPRADSFFSAGSLSSTPPTRISFRIETQGYGRKLSIAGLAPLAGLSLLLSSFLLLARLVVRPSAPLRPPPPALRFPRAFLLRTFPDVTVPHKFSRPRGSLPLLDSDRRVGQAFYDGFSPEQIRVLFYSATEVAFTWVAGNATALLGLRRHRMHRKSLQKRRCGPAGSLARLWGSRRYWRGRSALLPLLACHPGGSRLLAQVSPPRALPPRVQLHARPERACAHHGGRQREHRDPRGGACGHAWLLPVARGAQGKQLPARVTILHFTHRLPSEPSRDALPEPKQNKPLRPHDLFTVRSQLSGHTPPRPVATYRIAILRLSSHPHSPNFCPCVLPSSPFASPGAFCNLSTFSNWRMGSGAALRAKRSHARATGKKEGKQRREGATGSNDVSPRQPWAPAHRRSLPFPCSPASISPTPPISFPPPLPTPPRLPLLPRRAAVSGRSVATSMWHLRCLDLFFFAHSCVAAAPPLLSPLPFRRAIA